jgi:serine/threonine-protein kinase
VVTPWYLHGSLADRSGGFGADDARTVARHGAQGLFALHQSGVIHGNVTPTNLLVAEDGTISVDGSVLPGLAPHPPADEVAGHIPPEVLEGQLWEAPGDVWALGSCLHTLLRGRLPWSDAAERGAVAWLLAMSTEPPARTRRADVPAWLAELINGCLAADADARPSARQVAEQARTGPGPARAATEAGQTVGEGRPLGSNYLLLEPVGAGATGQVWRGQRRGDGAAVAVKILRPELTASPEAVARFLRERTTLVGLADPHLVSVLDLVAEGPTLAIVMEFVDGRDLRSLLTDRGPLPGAEACDLLSQVAAGVAAMHRAGLVHRDLKPENVLVQTGPLAKVTDFGIARALSGPSVTRTEQLVGTAEYLAPELVAGRALTPAVDVYSLGVLLYEMVVGRRPFEGEHPAALLRSHLDAAPPRPDGLPDPVWDLIERMMAKDPADRPEASAVVNAAGRLAEWLMGPDRSVPPPPVPAAGPPVALRFGADPPEVVSLEETRPASGETSDALDSLRLRTAQAAADAGSAGRRPHRRRNLIAGLVFLILAAAGAGAGYSLSRGHARVHPTYPLDVTSSVSVAANGTVTVRWQPVQGPNFEVLLISARAGPNGVAQPTPVPNATVGVLELTGTPTGLHCFQALAYFTAKPPANLAPHNKPKECLTVP